jgi:hypothetical protein
LPLQVSPSRVQPSSLQVLPPQVSPSRVQLSSLQVLPPQVSPSRVQPSSPVLSPSSLFLPLQLLPPYFFSSSILSP